MSAVLRGSICHATSLNFQASIIPFKKSYTRTASIPVRVFYLRLRNSRWLYYSESCANLYKLAKNWQKNRGISESTNIFDLLSPKINDKLPNMHL